MLQIRRLPRRIGALDRLIQQSLEPREPPPGSDVDGVRSSIFVDAASSYALTDRLRLSLEATNLTNEWAAQYSDSTRKDPLYQTLTGRTYTMGASYRF